MVLQSGMLSLSSAWPQQLGCGNSWSRRQQLLDRRLRMRKRRPGWLRFVLLLTVRKSELETAETTGAGDSSCQAGGGQDGSGLLFLLKVRKSELE
jgi:hypothetical protein